MPSQNSKLDRCSLCQKKSTRLHDMQTKCPISRKDIYTVLLFISRSSNSIVHIPRQGKVCSSCYVKITDYDSCLVRVLQKQQNITLLLEKSLLSVDSDIENECNLDVAEMDELTNAENYDKFVSASEIQQTVTEASSTYALMDKFNKSSEERHSTILHCNFCASRFKSKIRLQKHIAFAHKKFCCTLCDYSHRNEDYVKLHMNLHEGKSENQCRFCDKDFTTKISTIRHMEAHLDSKKYQCDKCGICFSQTTVLYNHRLQHEAEEQPLRCEICNQLFKTKRTFRHHMITHRVDRPRYSCDYCNKTFTEKYTLKVHKRSHLEACNDSKPQKQVENHYSTLDSWLSCVICGQTFLNKEQLNKHMEKEHDVIIHAIALSNLPDYD